VSSGFVLKSATRRRAGPVEALPEHAEPLRHRVLSNHVKECDGVEEYAAEIGKLWSEAQAKFLAIGRYLVKAKSRLAHGEFEAMVATRLPFGKNVAYQLRIVALAVDQDRLMERDLPKSYSNAFRLAKLEDPVLYQARERNLVRPDVTRREIEEFLQAVGSEDARARPDRGRVFKEIERLRQRVSALTGELEDARAKLAELEGLAVSVSGMAIEGSAEEQLG